MKLANHPNAQEELSTFKRDVFCFFYTNIFYNSSSSPTFQVKQANVGERG